MIWKSSKRADVQAIKSERLGDKLWVVEVIAPFGGAEEMVKDLKEKVFPEKQVHFLAVDKDGKQVRVL